MFPAASAASGYLPEPSLQVHVHLIAVVAALGHLQQHVHQSAAAAAAAAASATTSW